MKKKLIAIVMVCIMMFALVGCNVETYKDTQEQEIYDTTWGKGYFTVVKRWGDIGTNGYMIVYANDTKVMYFIDNMGERGGITPLYNADGTLQVYNED